MTKIDESKQYKFSEIIAMLENKELAEGTEVFKSDEKDPLKFSVCFGDTNSLELVGVYNLSVITVPVSGLNVGSQWSIKLPEEDKFYLKAPKRFYHRYLNFDRNDKTYSLSDKEDTTSYETQFTQKEINSMTFDTKFFEKIKVEQCDE
ncbi:hypothetical protein BN424_2648 [Carnobacterium maltaromaticum LMA28]|uniref:Uncharacterized protein n=1 Tax=Carnobacterium maltaromaticum LMA28 TaxID=1234679 RepID=R7RTL8_CARML|nr:hypothetical protein [Carnobacterium maltaromaticum]CDF59517.1 hypothetical protein BN424_2648 [Carnobacterium maltaromaticum LMA28]